MASITPNGLVTPVAIEAIINRTLTLPHDSLAKLTNIAQVIDLPHPGGNQIAFYHL